MNVFLYNVYEMNKEEFFVRKSCVVYVEIVVSQVSSVLSMKRTEAVLQRRKNKRGMCLLIWLSLLSVTRRHIPHSNNCDIHGMR